MTAPGWYPDPGQPDIQRWWGGASWTGWWRPPPRPTRARDWLIVAAVVVAAVGVLVAWRVGGGGSGRDVTFTLTGTAAAADITYSIGDGGTEQRQNVALPAQLTFPARSGDFLSIVAQNNGGGSLTCGIVVGGSTVVTHTSRGQYSVVTCAGTA